MRYADTAALQYNNVSPPLRKRLNVANIFALLVIYGSPVNATALNERLAKGPAYYLERFYYDTANAMTIHPLASLTKLVKPTQIVFGTDFPFLTARDTAAGLRAVGLFTPTELQEIERGNAAELMPRYKA